MMDYPDISQLTWCVEHNIAFISEDCPLCDPERESVLLEIDHDCGATIADGVFRGQK